MKTSPCIARRGRFELRYKTYLGAHRFSNKDIEIVAYNISPPHNCYTIASFTTEGEIQSCGDRLLKELTGTDDVSAIQFLAKIGSLIMESDEVFDNNEVCGQADEIVISEV